MAQLISVKLSRFDGSPWGFRLQGGKDFGTPLIVQKVSLRSIIGFAVWEWCDLSIAELHRLIGALIDIRLSKAAEIRRCFSEEDAEEPRFFFRIASRSLRGNV